MGAETVRWGDSILTSTPPPLDAPGVIRQTIGEQQFVGLTRKGNLSPGTRGAGGCALLSWWWEAYS